MTKQEAASLLLTPFPFPLDLGAMRSRSLQVCTALLTSQTVGHGAPEMSHWEEIVLTTELVQKRSGGLVSPYGCKITVTPDSLTPDFWSYLCT